MSLPTSVEPVNAILSTPGMRDQRGAAWSRRVPVRMLTTPGGKPASLDELAEAQRGQRGLLGGLEHAGAAGGERRARASTPPWPAGNSTARSARRRRRARAARTCGTSTPGGPAKSSVCKVRAVDLGGPARHVAEVVARAGDVDDARHELASCRCRCSRSRRARRHWLDEIRQLPQQRLALIRRHVGPRALLERLARRRDRAIHIRGPGIRRLRRPWCRWPDRTPADTCLKAARPIRRR